VCLPGVRGEHPAGICFEKRPRMDFRVVPAAFADFADGKVGLAEKRTDALEPAVLDFV